MQGDDDSSDNEGLAFQIRADLDDLRPRLSSQRKRRQTHGSENGPVKLNKLQRATRSERSIVRANRRLRRPPPPCPRPPLVKTASRQSLHSRRHLAHMLAFQVQLGHPRNFPYCIMQTSDSASLFLSLNPSHDMYKIFCQSVLILQTRFVCRLRLSKSISPEISQQLKLLFLRFSSNTIYEYTSPMKYSCKVFSF
jgi:hypothetical protein